MKRELKRAFLSPYFLCSFGLLFLCFQGYPIPSWFATLWLEPEFRESAFQLSIGPIFFGSVMLIMPFCASVSHAFSQVEEIQSSMMHWRVLRSSVKRYASVKIIASALSAACSTSLAFIVNAVMWNLIAIPVDPIRYPSHEIGWGETCLYRKWYLIAHGLPVYAQIAIGIAFSAAIWAVVTLAVAAWIPDRLLAVSVPASIYYLWHLQLPRILFGVDIPHPGTLYNDALTIESALECIAVYAVVFLISLLVYWAGLRRRACHV